MTDYKIVINEALDDLETKLSKKEYCELLAEICMELERVNTSENLLEKKNDRL